MQFAGKKKRPRNVWPQAVAQSAWDPQPPLGLIGTSRRGDSAVMVTKPTRRSIIHERFPSLDFEIDGHLRRWAKRANYEGEVALETFTICPLRTDSHSQWHSSRASRARRPSSSGGARPDSIPLMAACISAV